MIEAAMRAVRRERRRTVDEREAFEAFAHELRSVPVDGDAVRTPAGVGTRFADPAGGGTDAVREIYERTVMGVPHYREDYGDTYGESLAAEFGPEVAAALTGNDTLTVGVRTALVREAREARAERARFVPTLDDEASALRSAAEELGAVLDELAELDEEPLETLDFGSLDAIRARLCVLGTHLERVGTERQEGLREQRRDLSLPDGVPDVPTYLYQDVDRTYPVLAVVARTASVLDRRRRRVERAMARAH